MIGSDSEGPDESDWEGNGSHQAAQWGRVSWSVLGSLVPVLKDHWVCRDLFLEINHSQVCHTI